MRGPKSNPWNGQLVKVLGEVEAFAAAWVRALLPGDRGRGLPFSFVTSHNNGSEHTLDYSNDACAFG